MGKVLINSDAPGLRGLLAEIPEQRGYEVVFAGQENMDEAVRALGGL
jgi:hypothetical protein